VTSFEISPNQFDQIVSMKSTTFGVWLVVRGSTNVFLYDELTYECKLVFDTLANSRKNLENVN